MLHSINGIMFRQYTVPSNGSAKCFLFTSTRCFDIRAIPSLHHAVSMCLLQCYAAGRYLYDVVKQSLISETTLVMELLYHFIKQVLIFSHWDLVAIAAND
jgi:hypothetical protein